MGVSVISSDEKTEKLYLHLTNQSVPEMRVLERNYLCFAKAREKHITKKGSPSSLEE